MTLPKTKYLKSKKTLLNDFGIIVTKDMMSKIEELYPDEILVEQYTRRIILDKLKNFD